ncbi:uncharacterized protein L969DRAFT_17336 [Mixia osmundae IAM 14324]|uniref:Signal recognition particle SRP19 subunit n=1 Tax=Mixia osmundae (strain CBS 9802 / IAM 14324 / JCM 22182 / KY 12970) TaxID=764103 RepID=G7E3M1_MIXOS|nr:uncharacterized protein L969DRAFT_17336 [Mixia osmundae IAM 14324]KEI39414.1 hypothetical protein L969DRAFT_17336 [Mixia osmundae IAM 14324]GAA97431.1 hypothetical protein E5Q_04109 [Mixia osmundae IAM 14324]
MAQRQATIMDADDVDDFDFPLPDAPRLPPKASYDEDMDLVSEPYEANVPDRARLPPSQTAARKSVPAKQGPSIEQQAMSMFPGLEGKEMLKDDSLNKRWTSLYPIYFDAARPRKGGQRRVPLNSAVWYPHATDVANAAHKLGLRCVLEPDRFHPREWENPGRVKVLVTENGKFAHPVIRQKHDLLLKVAAVMRAGIDVRKVSEKRPDLPIDVRLPRHSPALSHGTLASALAGGGIPGMPPGMAGLMGGAGEQAEIEAPPKPEPKPSKGKRRVQIVRR